MFKYLLSHELQFHKQTINIGKLNVSNQNFLNFYDKYYMWEYYLVAGLFLICKLHIRESSNQIYWRNLKMKGKI